MRVFVTGVAGYIGSHPCVALLEAGYEIIVIDNLCNSSEVALERVQEIPGRPLPFVCGDVRNPDDLAKGFEDAPEAVLHFAAPQAVVKNCKQPLDYLGNILGGTIALVQAMRRAGVNNLMFISPATVYDEPDTVPVTEDAPLRVTNRYRRTKLAMEDLIRHWCRAMLTMGAVLLRYFKPLDAHPSGRIGEDPRGVPNNLMLWAAQMAVGRGEGLQVSGGDYSTPAGAGVRDHIHVVNLADVMFERWSLA